MTEVASLRRPVIADRFQRLGYIAMSFSPRFIDDGRTFTVVFMNMNYQASIHSNQVKRLLAVLGDEPKTALELMEALELSHRASFRSHYLVPAIDRGLVERTIPDKPNSRLQKYRKVILKPSEPRR